MRYTNLSKIFSNSSLHRNLSLGLALSLGLPVQAQISFDAPLSLNAGTSPSAVVLGDFNRDGKVDIASTDQFSGRAFIFLNRGALPPTTQQVRVGKIPFAIATADLDQDQDLDLVITNSGGGSKISVLRNQGQGTFAAAQSYTAGAHPSALALGDFDQDGDIDVAVTNIGPGTISILKNNGNGSFAAPQSFATGSIPLALASGDLNGDGLLDLVVANSGSENLGIYINQGQGNFTPAVTLSTPNAPQGVALGDLDGDGDLDIAASNLNPQAGRGPSSALIFKNNGNAGFGAPQSYVIGSYASGVALGDLDGDGDLEVVVANKGVNIEDAGIDIPGTISTLTNQGNGSFAPAQTATIGNFTQPTGVAVGDLDGDGDLDVASADAGYAGFFLEPGQISVLLNTTP